MDTEEDDLIYKIFSANSITMIHEILTMSKDDINGLTFTTKDGVQVSPPPHILAKLHILKAWNTYLLEEYNLKIIDWDNKAMINEEAYNQFRVSIYNAHQKAKDSSGCCAPKYCHLRSSSLPDRWDGSQL